MLLCLTPYFAKMENTEQYLNDEGKQRLESLRWALNAFNEGIDEFYRDEFQNFHLRLKQQTSHLAQKCNISCSKRYKKVTNWCQICSTWRTAIMSGHKYRTRMNKDFDWTITDSSTWPEDSSEVEKVFFPSWCKGAEDASDLSIRLNIMVNCFQTFGNSRQLEALRDIRNFAAHNANITETKMNKYFHTITSFLKTPALIQYTSAKESLDIIEILRKHSIWDIIENKLLSDEIRTRLEYKIYRGASRSKHHCIPLLIATILVFIALFSTDILQAIANGKKNYDHVGFRIRSVYFFCDCKSMLLDCCLEQCSRSIVKKGNINLVTAVTYIKSLTTPNILKCYCKNLKNLVMVGTCC